MTDRHKILVFLATIAHWGYSPAVRRRRPRRRLAPRQCLRLLHRRPARSVVFTELATGFSTSDLRDVNEQILQLNTAGELVWTADGTHLAGYRLDKYVLDGVRIHSIYSNSVRICAEGCSLEVRFGTKDGERHAYLTADYGHDNPGTIVDVEVADNTLSVTRTRVFPPGSPTLSGVVFEVTPTGQLPVEGAVVFIGISSGYRSATTDRTGSYRIPGLFEFHGARPRVEGRLPNTGYCRVDTWRHRVRHQPCQALIRRS